MCFVRCNSSWSVVGRTVVSNSGKGVNDSTRHRRREGGKLAFDILYIFMYNAYFSSSDDIMRPRISIGDWNGFSLDDISLLIRCYYLFAYCTTSLLSWSARYILSALDFNGPIAMWFFILSHFTYVKSIGLYLQLTAGAFEYVLRGATGDRLWWAGESGFKRQWKRRFARWNMFGMFYQ